MKAFLTGKDVTFHHPDVCTECAKQLDLNPAPVVYVINIKDTKHIVYVTYFSWDKIEYPDKFEQLAKERQLSHLVIKASNLTLCGVRCPIAYSGWVVSAGREWLWRPFAELLLSLHPELCGNELVGEAFQQCGLDLTSLRTAAVLLGNVPELITKRRKT